KLQAALSLHVAHLSRGVAVEAMIDPGKDAASTPPAAAPIGSAEVALELGLLALELGGEAESPSDARSVAALARALLEAALASDPASARAQAALAEARVLGGDPDAALPLVRSALAASRDDPRIEVAAGRVELARAEAAGRGTPAAAASLAAAAQDYERA